MKDEEFVRRLELAEDFGDVFELVRDSVDRVLEERRVGLSLGLAELPNMMGAMHGVGSNMILMNRTILECVKRSARSRLEVNSFVYHILLHEYLHSLGHIDEKEVRALTRKVTTEVFGEDHLAARISSQDLWHFYPGIRELGPGEMGNDVEIVEDFDKTSTTYIS